MNAEAIAPARAIAVADRRLIEEELLSSGGLFLGFCFGQDFEKLIPAKNSLREYLGGQTVVYLSQFFRVASIILSI